MCKNSPSDYYKRLDKAELKAAISDLANDYPCIEKISLYRMKKDKVFPDEKYVFVVVTPDFPPKSDRETELAQNIIKYYEETDAGCSHIYHLMEDFYRIDRLPENKLPDNYQEEWFWFSIKPGERIEDYEMVMDVEPLVLYEGDDQPCSAASAVVASPATPSSAEGRISENSNDSPYKQIKGEEIINLLSIAPFELIEYMEYGLPAYTPSGKEVFIRSDLNRGPSQKVRDKASRRHTVHKMSKARGQGGLGSDISPDPPGLHGIDLPLPENEKKAREILKEILGFYFLIDDYEEFAKIHGLESLIDRTDPEISKKSVRSKSEPAANKPEPISAEKDADQENFASALGKKGAHRRWDHYNELMDKALKLADSIWANGDDSWHSEMAEHLVSKSEYRELEPYRKALQKKLIPIADNYGRVRGKKGATKEKK